MQTMSIGIDDSTLDLLHSSNVNSNHHNNSTLSQEIDLSMVNQPQSQQQQQQQQIASNAISQLSHSIAHPTTPQTFLSTNPQAAQSAPQPAKITSENVESINDKKRKLTLPLHNTQSSPSEVSSISSSDSITFSALPSSQSSNPSNTVTTTNNLNTNTSLNNTTQSTSLDFAPSIKRQKYLTHELLVNSPSSHLFSQTETPSNKDLLNHLDQSNKLNTPQIEKFLHDLRDYNTLKTPGSTMAYFTPSNSLSFNQFNFTSSHSDDANQDNNPANLNANNTFIINNDPHQYSGIIQFFKLFLLEKKSTKIFKINAKFLICLIAEKN